MPFRLFPNPARDERNAWFLWLLLFVGVALENALSDSPSVSREYLSAAQRWMLGEPLYSGDGRGFLYLPQAAILHVPLSRLGTRTGEIVWRLATISLFALGIRSLCRLSHGWPDGRLFVLASSISLPIAVSAARNGQATLLISGLTMLAVGALVRRQYSRSALLLCSALAFKPTALPYLLLAGALHRAMVPRLLAGTVTLALVPYLLQDSTYATSQYVAFGESLQVTAAFALFRPFSNVFSMLSLAGLPVPVEMQTACSLAAAAATLLLCLVIQRRLPARRYGIQLVAVTTAYTLLFNPRTENNSYACIAPVLGLLCGEAFLVQRDRTKGVFLLAVAILLLSSYELSVQILPDVAPVWMAPLVTIYWCAVAGIGLAREIDGSALLDHTTAPAGESAVLRQGSLPLAYDQPGGGRSLASRRRLA